MDVALMCHLVIGLLLRLKVLIPWLVLSSYDLIFLISSNHPWLAGRFRVAIRAIFERL